MIFLFVGKRKIIEIFLKKKYNKNTKLSKKFFLKRKEAMLQKEILEKYHPLQLLHQGLGGDVWLVEHIGLSSKRVLKAVEKSHPQYDILAREAKVLQQCQHPSIPIIYDILEFDTQTYIIEEFIEGENLKQYILRQNHLSDSLLLHFSIQLCEILQFLHHPTRAILHLDLKPDNILVSNHQLKLIDFGSAICQNQQKKSLFIFGTPKYCAPEMKEAGVLTERTDIYLLGRCMEYMLMFTPKITKGYSKIVDKCLRKQETQYLSVEEIKYDLEQLRGKKRLEKPKETWYAVTGVLSEYDSSLIALQLAICLSYDYRKSVLYLDCTKHGGLETLESFPIDKKKKTDGFVFEREGITIAKRVAPQEIKGWRGRGYDYIVCDFGSESPLHSECFFSSYFFVGAVTEWTIELWKTALFSFLGMQKIVIALTGGDEVLAKEVFGELCYICKVNTYFTLFKQEKQFSKQVRRLLN